MNGKLGLGELIIFLTVIVPSIWLAWRICAKTGNSGALGVGALIPGVNIILVLYLAFSEWPIERELKQLKATATTH